MVWRAGHSAGRPGSTAGGSAPGSVHHLTPMWTYLGFLDRLLALDADLVTRMEDDLNDPQR